MAIPALLPAKMAPSRPLTSKHPQFEPFKHRLLRLADGGRLTEAIAALDYMSRRGIPADLLTYSSLLKSCIRSRDLHLGNLIHRRLLDSGLSLDTIVTNSLITLYSKCGDWDTACSIFEQMGINRNLVSWTSMISSAAGGNMERRAIAMFCEMLELGFFPNEFTFSSVIQACSSSEYVSVGRVVLGFVIKTGFWGEDVSVGSALIDMFAKDQDLVSARKVFDGMLVRNLVVWTLMITRYAQLGCGQEALELFLNMFLDGLEPDQFLMSSVLAACAELGSLQVGKQLHSLAIRIGLAFDVCVGCSLVNMYAKCALGGPMDDSRRVFEGMHVHNVMSWTALITGYVQSGHDEEALKLFGEMIKGDIQPNHFTYSSILKACANLCEMNIGEQVYARIVKSGLATVSFVGNSLVTMYAKSGRMEEARKAFDVLYEKNLVSYNAIVDGYVKNSNSEEAFELVHHIHGSDVGGVSAFTFASLFAAIASIGMMGKGQQLHAQLLKSGFVSDKCINNALVSMYSKCGNIEDAVQAFQEMNDRNTISWTSMITGLAKHGHADKALELFRDMVSKRSMQNDHGIIPRMEHYACMVDLLGRAGCLEEAMDFISSMPVKADALVWRTLLAACRTHGHPEFGEKAARQILDLEPHDPAAYILLSNLYALKGQWEKVARIRSCMKEKSLNKEAGLSWIEIESIIYKFHAGDTSHRRSQEIFAKLDELATEIKQLGYVPDTSSVLHDIDNGLREKYVWQHSERLAVAFGLISTSAPKPIRVFKNLRVCGDCHSAMKFISMVTCREIILRDSNRFHRIKDGKCSCGDYW
ncbi:hypothetical protein J5N97_028160 [Dioscorea zingiberensis]|uniref:DYW domain-containing protein n=1 Tax=Dioscorea zingiberensis TaxID=325984 RepID=A0A9D5BYJ3_9LILI|nr:hypothetical protein J5N97_028160 [Dioscorea zingiberensis]